MPSRAAASAGATWALTDGNQRRAVSFGQIDNSYSYLLGPGQKPDGSISGVPLNYQVVSGMGTQTVSSPIGASSVVGYLGGLVSALQRAQRRSRRSLRRRPHDGLGGHRGRQLGRSVFFHHLRQAHSPDDVRVTPLDDSPIRPSISRVTLATDAGAVSRAVPFQGRPRRAGGGPWCYPTPHHHDRCRPRHRPHRSFLGPLGAGITDVTIPGINFQPAMQLPTDELAIILHRLRGTRSCGQPRARR